MSQLADEDVAAPGLGASRGPEQSPGGTEGNEDVGTRTGGNVGRQTDTSRRETGREF